jgi:hypothetical protein
MWPNEALRLERFRLTEENFFGAYMQLGLPSEPSEALCDAQQERKDLKEEQMLE